ncbi:cation:proton antiporter [Paenibacillus sp. OV219]|uniref:cation:proton antiporter n=1 Tax=Paenibacillus sp. OV219 TaxID=1884377 RepID=UPI0008B783ED|nr:cation:proton antiporter [Paenibacillus sp. OV219]SEO83996.1 sodium/proton-potassium antiporter GerN, CPA2 family [Paenibacillus sp. OV219]
MLIYQLVIILIASKLAGHLSVRLGQPSVLGKLLIGIVLGPTVLGLIHETEVLKEISKIGVILLMFIAGLETDLAEFKRTGKSAAYVGLSGIIVPFGLGYAAGVVLDMSNPEAIFLGLLLSATSVSISVQALKEMGKLKSPEGSTILGAAVIDDVVVIIALAFVMSFTGGDVNLGLIIVKKGLFFAVALLFSWLAVPWFLRRFSSLRVTETVISAGLVLCFSYAYFAEYTGVADIIGAYIAGVAISVTDYKHEIFEKVESISYSIFVPVFFTSIGVAVEFHGLTGSSYVLIIVLSLIAIISKLAGAAVGAKLSGFGWRPALGIGAAMVSRGEVALIIASIGLEEALISKSMFAVIVVVVLITTIVTPPMMKLFFKEEKRSLADS